MGNDNFEPYSYQLDIAEQIYFKKNKRLLITAPRRSGKTLILAFVSVLYALKYNGSDIKIIAPSYKQAKILMDYIRNHVTDSQDILKYLPIENKSKIKKELSKQRVQFTNDSQIMILSAQGEGERLLGHGADLLICDESPLISDETFNSKILTMMGESKESMLVEIGNPVRLNHFYEHHEDERWKNMRVELEDCIEEGRFDEEFIQEQKMLLTEREYKIYYLAQFPKQIESGLIKYDWLMDAVDRELDIDGDLVAGLDVGRTNDLSVLTICEKDGNKFRVKEIKDWQGKDTKELSAQVKNNIDKNTPINVDATGMGEGVYDELNHSGYNANEVLVGKSATREKDKFLNLKAQYYWRLRGLFEDGQISIPKHRKLIKQLRKMKLEYTSKEKRRIIDPEKSPDFADSLMLALAQRQHEELSIDTMSQF